MLNKLLFTVAYKDKQFEEHLNKYAIQQAYIFAWIIFSLEIMMLAVTFAYPSFFADGFVSVFRGFYIFLAVTSLFGIMIMNYIKINHLYHLKSVKFLMVLIAIIGIVWGALLSGVDISLGGSTSVYLTFVLMFSAIMISRPDLVILELLIGELAFIIAIPKNIHYSDHIINSIIFIIFAWFIVRQNYKKEYEKYLKDELLFNANETLEKKNKKLKHLSEIDHLTGLYNRYSLDKILNKAWTSQKSKSLPLTVLMIDIDYFKQFNDHYGHIKGDECIVNVAHVLKQLTEQYRGYTFRYGGDEFCIIITEEVEINSILKELNTSIKSLEISRYDGQELTISIGYHQGIPNQDDEWLSVDLADQALYAVKEKRGRRKED